MTGNYAITVTVHCNYGDSALNSTIQLPTSWPCSSLSYDPLGRLAGFDSADYGDSAQNYGDSALSSIRPQPSASPVPSSPKALAPQVSLSYN